MWLLGFIPHSIGLLCEKLVCGYYFTGAVEKSVIAKYGAEAADDDEEEEGADFPSERFSRRS